MSSFKAARLVFLRQIGGETTIAGRLGASWSRIKDIKHAINRRLREVILRRIVFFSANSH
jgi:hypothetical protein